MAPDKYRDIKSRCVPSADDDPIQALLEMVCFKIPADCGTDETSCLKTLCTDAARSCLDAIRVGGGARTGGSYYNEIMRLSLTERYYASFHYLLTQRAAPAISIRCAH